MRPKRASMPAGNPSQGSRQSERRPLAGGYHATLVSIPALPSTFFTSKVSWVVFNRPAMARWVPLKLSITSLVCIHPRVRRVLSGEIGQSACFLGCQGQPSRMAQCPPPRRLRVAMNLGREGAHRFWAQFGCRYPTKQSAEWSDPAEHGVVIVCTRAQWAGSHGSGGQGRSEGM